MVKKSVFLILGFILFSSVMVIALTNNNQTVSGNWEVTLDEDIIDEFSTEFQNSGLTKDEFVSKIIKEYAEEKYSEKLLSRAGDKIYNADNSQIKSIIEGCTNLEIPEVNNQTDIESLSLEKREELVNVLSAKLQERKFSQVKNFIECSKNLL